MAGSTRLEGELNKKAVAMMAEVATVLESNKVAYALDCGTLLGIMREQRLLPWDNDIDFCASVSDLSRLRKAAFSLWLKGYRVRFARATQDWGPIRKGDPRILRVRNRKGFFSRGPLLLDIFIRYPSDNQQSVSMIGEGGKVIVQSFPSQFFDQRSYITFEGRDYPIPENYDAYLMHRYGDWRVPVKEWDYMEDDQSRVF